MSKEKLDNSTTQLMFNEPTPMDVISYAYFFVGIHKGPYYSAKVFNEYFELPYPTLSNYRTVTMDKVKKIMFGLGVYAILSWQFPLTMYYTKDFYKSPSEYRFLYNIPQVVQYIILQQILLSVCTCVCTETGLGVYPSKYKSLPGLGPQFKQSEMKMCKKKLSEYDISDYEEFSFTTVKCFDLNKIIYGPMIKDSFRGWDMPTQNWFWYYIYRGCEDSSKEVRCATSFLAWSIFCGPTIAQAILSSTLWICLNLESEFNNIYDLSKSENGAWNVCYSVIRAMCILYLTPCLILDDTTLIKYYSSIYWSFHVLLLFAVIAAICIVKLKAN